MLQCPKCGSFDIHGPYYKEYSFHSFAREVLRYICGKCGFKKDEPTLDARA